MSAPSDLYDRFKTDAATLTDDYERLECLADIEAWYACRQAVDSVQSGGVSSYTIAGRSITRHSVGDFQRQERMLYLRVMGVLRRRGVAYVDLRYPIDAGGVIS